MGEIELGAAAEATIQAYKELSSVPSKRLALALDQTCIQFLAYVIAEGEGSLVQSAIDTLAMLAESPDCRPPLANTFGVLESLQDIADNEEKFSEPLRDKATALFTCLQYSKHIAKVSNNTTAPSTSKASNKNITDRPDSVQSTCSTNSNSDRTPTPLDKDTIDNTDGEPKSINSDTSRSNMSSKRSISNKPKTVTLFIRGMVNPEQRKLVEEKLVRVRGLVSIVFDMTRSRVTCRVKRDLSIEKLALAVEKTETMKALQVITGPDGKEEMLIIGDTELFKRSTITTSIDEDLPDYLSEEEAEADPKSAMAPSGSFIREAATSFLTTAADILQKSFYW